MKDKITHLLKLVLADFIKFADRIVVLIFVYGRFAALSIALSLIIPLSLRRYLGVPHDVSMMIMRVLLTVTPILPTVMYAELKEEDYQDEFSMDLCFVAWIITIVFAWWVI